MVRYNGRNKLLTTAVNGNQIGLKMSGNAPSVGRAISTRRYTKRRVRDNLKYCGPVYYRGQLWSFNSDNCVEKAPLTQASAGGVGHINHPRKKCNVNCSLDICEICEAIKLIRQYFIHRFGEDGIVLVAPQETLQSDGINDVINGEKIYHFDSNHAEYYSLPRKIRDAVDTVNNLKLKYRLKDSPEKIVHIVGYIAPSLQKTLREKFFGNYEETFGSGANEETLYGFGYGFSYYNIWSIIALFRNNGYTQGINYKGEHFATLNELSRVPFLATGSLQRLFQDDHLIGGSQHGQIQSIMEMDQWDTSNISDMSYMFSGASKFNGDISKWNTGKVQIMQYMFQNATSFTGELLVNWNTFNVHDMSHMFDGATNFNQDIDSWNTSNVIDMSYMFSGASKFNGEIGGWDTSNVTDMSYMFSGASEFNQDIGGWNTSNVTDMSSMFSGASDFNQDISDWDVSRVTTMNRMFGDDCFFNQNISDWDVSNVTNYDDFSINMSPQNLPIFN
jgi:surface protein